jgi:glutamine cyclotransferase
MPRRRKNRKRSWVFPIVAVLALALIIGWAVSQRGVNASQQTGNADYEIIARYPHDVDAYTQGLYFEDGFLFEGTGRPGTSWLRKVEIDTGNVLQEISLSSQFFGEGIVTLDSRIFQLTWHSGLGFIYDKDTFRQIGQFRYPGEGWGLTTDGESLIMSDGSASLRFLDPDSFTEVRRIEVRGPSGPIMDLNELEFINGSVYANVWFSNSIVQIDPSSGEVLREIDFTPLYIDARPSESDAVLNGIAYDSETDRLFVTGKLWPTMYEIRLKTP